MQDRYPYESCPTRVTKMFTIDRMAGGVVEDGSDRPDKDREKTPRKPRTVRQKIAERTQKALASYRW